MICHNCGQESPESFRFCPACAAPLDQVAAPAREERKVVTVLFADLVGFTSRSEQLDPEDVRAVLAPYHARLREEFERYGGTVEKFIGSCTTWSRTCASGERSSGSPGTTFAEPRATQRGRWSLYAT